MAPDWADALAPVEAQLREALAFVAAEVAAGHGVLPSPSNLLRAFRQPLAGVRVLMVGQDPYPTPGHAVGLSFAVDGATRPIPRSLANIYKELEADLGFPPRVHGDLSPGRTRAYCCSTGCSASVPVRPARTGARAGRPSTAAVIRPSPAAVRSGAGQLRSSRSCGARTPRPCGRCWGPPP